jgi:Tol biopolymer transport system component/Ca2+-binding EF-hand superfamily protein
MLNSGLRLLCACSAILFAACGSSWSPCLAVETTDDPAATLFQRLDRDANGSLTRDEFVGEHQGDAAAEAERQFRTFDFDGNGATSLAEFRNVPLYVAEADRGPLIDPLVNRANHAIQSLEKRWPEIDLDADGTLTRKEFDEALLSQSIPGLEKSTFKDWDRDQNNLLTADEARLTIEIAFGVRRPQGEAIRLKNGDSISWFGFKFVDRNHDDHITLDEALLGYDRELNEPRFHESDKNSDGMVSFAEWADSPFRHVPGINTFLAIDADRNGKLSREELVAGIPDWQRPLGHYLVAAFDDNRDGTLSLYEFLATPIACHLHRWNEPRNDTNANGRLEFDEFRWDEGLDSAALDADDFRRFDGNHDGTLTIDEFFFKSAAVAGADLFPIWDADGNGSISEQEMILRSPQPPAVAREFRVFDLDHNNALSREEFATVPSVVWPGQRDPLADPLESVIESHIAEITQALLRLGAGRKTTANDLSRAARQVWQIDPAAQANGPLPDQNRDGQISEEELRTAIRSWLGAQLLDGTPLRKPDGRVSNLMLFLNIDADNDWHLSADEYTSSPYTKTPGLEGFRNADANHSDMLTPEEWWQVPGLGTVDPITEFLHLDENLDGRVDPHELASRCPDWKRPLAKAMFPGFDDDNDGFFSLNEYRHTPVANPLLEWQTLISDPNNDGRLTLAEFQYGGDPFPLLRRDYFRRLDINDDEVLSENEFPFRTMHPDAFFVMNSDGTGWRKLFQFEGYQACGSPTITPDGKQIAFDAWKVEPQRSSTGICLVNMDGTGAHVVFAGAMPSYSPDGKHVTYSSSGVTIADNLGQVEKQIAVQAWGCQWSPDGQSIAYYDNEQLMLLDLQTEQSRALLRGPANPFSSIFWNLAWSPDSRRLCFKAGTPQGQEQIVLVDAAGAEFGLTVRYTGTAMNSDFAWHPNGERIVFSKFCPERGKSQLYEFSPDDNAEPTLVTGQNETTNNTDACWTPDGRQLIVIVGDY